MVKVTIPQDLSISLTFERKNCFPSNSENLLKKENIKSSGQTLKEKSIPPIRLSEKASKKRSSEVYLIIILSVWEIFIALCILSHGNKGIFFLIQKFPTEGLSSVVRNVFDFDSYNNDMREILINTLHKYGIPIGAKPSNVQLAKE